MYTDTSIIRQAMRRARLGRADIQTIEDFKDSYNFIKRELLDRRPWLFTLELLEGKDLREAETDTSLGLNYKYVMPSYVSNVLDVNTGDRKTGRPIGYEQALTIGIAIEPGSVYVPEQSTRFVFHEGILHSANPVKTAVVQKRASEAVFTSAFATLLEFEFATFLLSTELKDDIGADSLRRQALDKFIIASNDRPVVSDTKTRALVNWLDTYYRGQSY